MNDMATKENTAATDVMPLSPEVSNPPAVIAENDNHGLDFSNIEEAVTSVSTARIAGDVIARNVAKQRGVLQKLAKTINFSELIEQESEYQLGNRKITRGKTFECEIDGEYIKIDPSLPEVTAFKRLVESVDGIKRACFSVDVNDHYFHDNHTEYLGKKGDPIFFIKFDDLVGLEPPEPQR